MIGKLLDQAMTIMAVLAGVLIIGCTLLVSLQVCSRYFFGWPWGWVVEFTEYSLVYMTFLPAAWILKRDRHVRMDLVFSLLAPRSQSLLSAITFFIGSIISLMLTGFGIRVTWDLFTTKYFTVTILEIPKFIVVGVIFVGFLFLFFQCIRCALAALSDWKKLKTVGS